MGFDRERESRLFSCQTLRLPPLFVFQASYGSGCGLPLRRQAPRLLGHIGSLGRCLLLPLGERRNSVAHAFDGRLLCVNRIFRGEARRLRSGDDASRALDLLSRGVDSCLAIMEIGLGTLERIRKRGARGGFELGPPDELEVAMRGLVQLQVFELAPIRDEALRFGGLAPQRHDVVLDLADDVADTQEILLRQLHLLLSLLLPAPKLRNPGRFLDEQTPIFGLRTHDQTDFALLDDGIRLGSGSRTKEKVGHVTKPDRRHVDEVFALARPVETARDRDLCIGFELERHLVRDVVFERQGHFREIMRDARIAAVENDVLHGTPTELASALFAHAPSNRVDDVRLPAAVWTYDCQNIVVETKDGSVDERLEANELELLDLHPCSRRSSRMDRPDVTSHIVRDRVQVYRHPRVQGKGKRGGGGRGPVPA
jgi:hypothetical protein